MTLIAINVLLDPDAATVERAQAVNARMDAAPWEHCLKRLPGDRAARILAAFCSA